MSEEEKEAVEIVNALKEWGKIHFIVKDRCHARLTYNDVYLLLNLIEKLQKENEDWSRAYKEEKDKQFKKLQKYIALKQENDKLKTIRYDTTFGTESIHLITEKDLVHININKYMIEIEDGKFVDLKQVYQENKKLKDDYISKQKIQDMIKELEEQDRKWTEELEEPYSNFKNVDRNLKRIKNQVDILEELLKGE